MANEPMLLYSFDDAPEELRALSTCGGDEDGILVVPAGQELPYWAERLWLYYKDPDEIRLPDGRTVLIWAHA